MRTSTHSHYGQALASQGLQTANTTHKCRPGAHRAPINNLGINYQQYCSSSNGTRVEPIKSMSEISGSINMSDVGFDLKRPSFLLNLSFFNRSRVDRTTSMCVVDDGYLQWGESPSSLLTSGSNPHSCQGSKNVGVVKTSSLLSKHSPRFTRRCSINNCHQTKPSKTSLELAPMESKDIFTQIIQSPPPPPAPIILKNSVFFLFSFLLIGGGRGLHRPDAGSKEASTRRQLRHKQAFTIETPLRDGRVKHYFVKSEQIGL